MEDLIRVKVVEISRENIKPSSPTPPHLKNLTLSLYDQTTAPMPTPTLLFYPAEPTDKKVLNITHLKTSLSQTLDLFYPLAGRYVTWGTIDCNDQGVPLVVTQVSCPISTILNCKGNNSLSFASKLELLSKFYPPTDMILIGNGIVIAIQINVFTCGGFVLGLYHSHKPIDGTSAATFLRHWSTRARAAQCHPQQLPDFEAALITSPPYQSEKDALLRPKLAVFDRKSEATNQELVRNKDDGGGLSLSGDGLMVRSFVFKGKAVSELKARAASVEMASPSRLLTVFAFIWKQLLNTDNQRHSAVGITVDVRPRTNPPLPTSAMGNLCQMVAVDLADHHDEPAELPQLVSEIHASIGTVKDLIGEYNGEKRGEVKIGNFYKFVGIISKYIGDFYLLVAWCKSAGFSDVNFGYGKPKWIVPTHERLYPFRKNTILLVDYAGSDDDNDDDGGFEAWLILHQKNMKMLESNQEFLTYASPCF